MHLRKARTLLTRFMCGDTSHVRKPFRRKTRGTSVYAWVFPAAIILGILPRLCYAQEQTPPNQLTAHHRTEARKTIETYVRAILLGKPDKLRDLFEDTSARADAVATVLQELAESIGDFRRAKSVIENRFGHEGRQATQEILDVPLDWWSEDEVDQYISTELQLYYSPSGTEAVARMPNFGNGFQLLKHQDEKWVIAIDERTARTAQFGSRYDGLNIGGIQWGEVAAAAKKADDLQDFRNLIQKSKRSPQKNSR